LEFQERIRRQLEAQPIRFLVRELEDEMDAARQALAEFVGADRDDLVFVTNATTGVNAVLRSLRFQAGEELLITDHSYNACANAVRFVADAAGARVVTASVPFPIRRPEQVVEAVLQRVTPQTRLALIDHVTSPTGLVWPLERLVQELQGRGVDVLVDGAHAPGMVPLQLQQLGAAYYTGNCHKWLCAPKGAGFLVVRRDRQHAIRPLTISHGANSPRTDRGRFLLEFGWTGTGDPSAFLSVPEALRTLGGVLPGGWPALLRRNHALALAAQRVLCEAREVSAPAPADMIGALAAVALPDGEDGPPPRSPLYLDPLQETWWREHRIEVPVVPWPARPRRLLRISAQLYNSLPQYERLAALVASKSLQQTS
jgi:isopenicillin-N epimerase